MSDLFSARLSIRALLLACAAGTLAPVAFAQEPAADDEMNITVTGRRISQ